MIYFILSKECGEYSAHIQHVDCCVVTPKEELLVEYYERCFPESAIMMNYEASPFKVAELKSYLESCGVCVTETHMNDEQYIRMCDFLKSGEKTVGERFAEREKELCI